MSGLFFELGKGGRGNVRVSVNIVSKGLLATMSEDVRESYCGREIALARHRAARMHSR